MMRRLVPFALVALGGCAAGQHTWSGASLCELTRPAGGELSSDTWLALLLRGYDPASRRATTPAVDCTGSQVRWEAPALQCSDGATTRTALPDQAITDKEVVVTPLGDDLRLVWIITSRFASGDALGPAAVVELKGARLVVRVVGALRASPTRAKLRLERIGPAEVLVAEGEQCATTDPASCDRSARVVLIERDRLRPTTVTSEAGACLMAGWFHLGREESERLPSGMVRRYRLDATMGFSPAGMTLSEQVVVHDLDPRAPAAPPRVFRRAVAEDVLPLRGDHFVSSGTSLWTRMRAPAP
jgi:hypothetical protein